VSPDIDALKAPLITDPFSCSLQPDKERCVKGGGACVMTQDGYYIVNMICVIIGVTTFVMFIRPKVLHLQSLPMRAWRLAPASKP
jgi:MFS transporter, PAT family, solute carrier family 33 (acetyl-CoA transportor), member 1